MKTKLIVGIALVAGGSLFGQSRWSVGIGIGNGGYYAAPPPVAYGYQDPYAYQDMYAQPPCPGPDYYWVPGSWYSVGPRRNWRAGYWDYRPAYRNYGRSYGYGGSPGYGYGNSYSNHAYGNSYSNHGYNNSYSNHGYSNSYSNRGYGHSYSNPGYSRGGGHGDNDRRDRGRH